jgi:hypothetical protein
MNKVLKIERYIQEFFSTRYSDYRLFYQSEHQHRRVVMYQLKNGSSLMDFLISIMGNIEEKIYVGKLVPQVYANPEKLIEYMKWFKDYLNENQKLLDINKSGDNTSYIIHEIQSIKTELVEMVDYLLMIYDTEDINIPYQELRHSLIIKDLDSFIRDMNSILASVSYAISKTQEGYLHSNIHLILKLLGFDILPEETTNIGRIDAVIRFSNIIYIFEFKLGTSDEALNQIKDKKYYEKFIIERKEIILVGVGFDAENRNVKDYKMEIHK